MIVKPSAFDLRKYLAAPVNEIQAASPASFKAEVIDLFYGERKDEGGRMPWVKTHNLIRFRPKEVTMWAGINGHGKSQVTTQCALDMAYNGEKVAIASFEMAPERTLWRMVRQAARTESPPVAYINAFLDWCDKSIYLLPKRGNVGPEYVTAAIRYCVAEYGVTQFVCDNLAKVVKGEDDFNGQKNFVDELCTVALDTGVHIHVIHHIRKGLSEFDVPGKFDIKGAGGITDLLDNAIIVWRNKRKEMAKGADAKLLAQADCKAIVCKQRNGSGWEGDINLWYHAPSMAYAENATDMPKRYQTGQDHSALI